MVDMACSASSGAAAARSSGPAASSADRAALPLPPPLPLTLMPMPPTEPPEPRSQFAQRCGTMRGSSSKPSRWTAHSRYVHLQHLQQYLF